MACKYCFARYTHEFHGIVLPEELVGVAGEAVLARHLAAPVGIEGPPEGHRSGVEPVQEARRSKFPILDAAPLVERRPHPIPHPRRWNSRLDPHKIGRASCRERV